MVTGRDGKGTVRSFFTLFPLGEGSLAKSVCGDRRRSILATAAKNPNPFNALQNNERHIPSALKPPA